MDTTCLLIADSHATSIGNGMSKTTMAYVTSEFYDEGHFQGRRGQI